MADTIGSMAATIRATAGQFDADLKQAGRSVDRFKSHVEASEPKGGILSMLSGGFGQGAGLAVGFAAVTAAVTAVAGSFRGLFAAVEEGERLGDLAAQIGATTEELTSLRFAADISGSSAQIMDDALAKLAQRLGEARAGTQETALAFQALGLDVDEFAKLSVSEQIKTIADKFQDVKNPADQAALAMDLFGKQGVKLVNVLNSGREGIEALQARSDELSNTLSTEDAAALSSVADGVDELKAAWGALWKDLTVAVAPALKTVLTVLTEIVSAASYVARAVGSLFKSHRKGMEEVSQQAKSGDNPIDVLKEQAKAAAEAKKKLDDLMRQGEQVTAANRTPQEEFNDKIADLLKLLDVGAIKWDTYRRAVEAAANDLDKATEAKQEFEQVGATPGVSSAQRGTSAAATAINQSMRTQMDLAKIALNHQKRTADEVTKQTRILQNIENALEQGGNARPVNI